MASQSMVRTFTYKSPQQPIFSVIESPLHYTTFTQTNSSNISFYSKIKPKDPTQNSQENLTNCTIDDTEISIFDAQKYFSENNDQKDKDVKTHHHRHQQQHTSHDLLSVPKVSSVSSVDGCGRNHRTRSFHAMPTVSSEASWNSQTGLLANSPGSMAVISLKNCSDQFKKRNSTKKWSFGRKYCCIGKNSVQIKEVTSDSDTREHVSTNPETNKNTGKYNQVYTKRVSADSETREPVSTNPEINKNAYPKRVSPEHIFASSNVTRQQRVSASGPGFSFPILNNSNHPTNPTLKPIITKSICTPFEDPPRESLEVFQPPTISRTSPFNPGSPIDDDMCSEASSDLFEIESFSTQSTQYPMLHRRDSLDEAHKFNARRFASSNNNMYGRRSIDEQPTPSVAATECYAPSEVSVDWSVTTAEGYDKGSVTNFSVSASEIGDMAFLRQLQQEEYFAGAGKRKGNGLLLMSCRHEKAVSVGPLPVKCVSPEGLPMFPLNVSGPGHVGGRPPRGNNHSARLSLAFAA